MNEQLRVFKQWCEENTLVHIEVVVQKLGRKALFGKIVRVDEEKQRIVLYDVDQKEVLSFSLNQIDSITPTKYSNV